MVDVRHVKLTIVSILALGVVYSLLDALVYAVVLTYLSRPLFSGLVKVLKNRTVSSGITTLVVLGVIIYPIILAIKSLALNLDAISSFVAGSVDKIIAFLADLGIPAGVNLSQMVLEKLVAWLGGFILATPGLLLKLFVMLAMIFYFHRDGPKLKEYIISLTQDAKQKSILLSIEKLLNAVIVGSFTTAIIVGIFSWACFTVMGIPYALPLAVLVGLAALLPILGSWMVYAPMAIYEYLQGAYMLVVVVLLIGVIAELMEIYLPPKISAHRTMIHPGILLLGFLGGPLFLGIKGIILGPIILGSLKIILDHYKEDIEKKFSSRT